MAAPFFFFLFAIVALIGALGLVLSRSPVSGALWLVLNLFCIAGLYVTLNAVFIGVIQVLVYAGAIMVLFLFVIMLLNLDAMPSVEGISWARAAGYVLAVVVLAQLTYVVAAGLDALPTSFTPSPVTGDASVLAVDLFTVYALPLEIIAILLLAATIGAVLLAQRQLE